MSGPLLIAEQKRLVNKAVKEVVTTKSAATFEDLQSKLTFINLFSSTVHAEQCFLPTEWPIFNKPATMKQLKNVLAIRVHEKERAKTEEAYYLAKVTGPLEQLKEGGMYEGNWYEKGYFVFPMKWYHYKGTTQVEGMAIGDRHYTLGAAASDSCTMQLNGVITGADKWTQFSKVITKKGRDKVFVLSASDHDLIMAKGTLSM